MVRCCLPQQTCTVVVLLCMNVQHALLATVRRCCLLPPLASSLVHAKNREAPGTHCLRMRLISPRCGDSRAFSDSSVSCDIRVQTRCSKLVRINIMACNESLDFQQAISHALQQLQLWFSTLRLHFAQIRFGKPSSSFNVISDRVLILDAIVFPG